VTHPSKSENSLNSLQRGAQTALINGKTLTIDGVVYNQQSFIQAVGVMVGRYDAVRHDRTQLAADIVTRNANEAAVQKFLDLTEIAVAYTFGEDSAEYTDFGFKPKKKPVELTAEQKQLKVDRMRATRTARNTLGSRQKKAVKGVVEPPAAQGGSAPASGTGKT
jgi:hypothetical protein